MQRSCGTIRGRVQLVHNINIDGQSLHAKSTNSQPKKYTFDTQRNSIIKLNFPGISPTGAI